MKTLLRFSLCIFLYVTVLGPAHMRAQAEPEAAAHDGRNDFDFDIGKWNTHSRRLMHPLADANDWIEMNGVTTVQKLKSGEGNIGVLETDGPNGHLSLLALRLYHPQSHQWSINFATSGVGVLGFPSNIGEFKNGRGEFYDHEEFNGMMILVRFSFWSVSPDKAHSEQAFSADGGKTWETNWYNDYTRISN